MNGKENPFFDSESIFESVPRKRKYSWVEENIFIKNGKRASAMHDASRLHMGNAFTKRSLRILRGLLFVLFGIIFTRVFFLQIVQGENYRLDAESNRQRIVPIAAERGLIFDRNGVQLTQNVPSFRVGIFPQELPKNEKRKEVLTQLSTLANIPLAEIEQILEEFKNYSYESIVIKDNIDYETALALEIASVDLPGVYIQTGSKRLYEIPSNNQNTEVVTSNELLTSAQSVSPRSMSLSHVLGYQAKINKEELDERYSKGYLPSDLIGKIGIEKTYEEILRGNYGQMRIEIDAAGREQILLAEDAPTAGKHIELTLDIKIQEKLEEAIQKYLSENNKKRAAAIALDPRNGEILAMVNLPSFDNNDFSGGISTQKYKSYIEDENRPLFNRAIGGTYPSGSVIKPVIGAAALSEGIITPNTTFLSNGGLRVSSWFFPDWQAGGHGLTDVRRSIAWSVNTFYYYIGGGYGDFEGLGVDRITEYLRRFGFSQKSGIDLPGEASGFLPSREWKEEQIGEPWYVGDTYNLSIGQGYLLVSPLQIANMTAAIANHGTLYQPHVLRSVFSSQEDKQFEQAKVLNENMIDRSDIDMVRLGMRDCVTYGSCRRLSLLPFNAAGKTGTAQWNNNKDDHGWFTSFAPFEDPQIVVTVLVEEGEGGSTVGAPILYEFYDWWGEYVGL